MQLHSRISPAPIVFICYLLTILLFPVIGKGAVQQTDSLFHVIQVATNGNTYVPVCPPGIDRQRVRLFPQHLNEILNKVRKTGKKRLYIVIHGGMKSLKASRKVANEAIPPMMDRGIYPIFINWKCDPGSAYTKHLIVHQGKVVSPAGAIFIAPFQLVADLGRAILRIPLVLFEQVINTSALGFDTHGTRVEPRRTAGTRPWDYKRIQVVNVQTCKLLEQSRQVGQMKVSFGRKEYGVGNTIPKRIRQELKGSGSLVIIDGLGKAMWNEMERRIRIMFVQPRLPKNKSNIAPNANLAANQRGLPANGTSKPRKVFGTNKGVIAIFTDSLIAFHKKHKDVSITLVGHSMGSIVINEMLGNYREELHTDTILFLAAACKLYDFRMKTVKYLEQPAHSNTQFYNVTLSPYREVTDRFVNENLDISIAASGSLLAWIDDFLSDPLTPEDRTTGRWENFALATTDPDFIPHWLYPRITAKALGAGTESQHGPQQHGGFLTVRDGWEFWRPRMREPDPNGMTCPTD